MIDHPKNLNSSNNSQQIPYYQTMTNLLSFSYHSLSPSSTNLTTLPTSSSSSSPSLMTKCSQHDLFYPSSIHHHSAEVIVSPHRSSLMNPTPFHYHHRQKVRNYTSEQTDSDRDLDSSSNSVLSSSSSTTNINITNSSPSSSLTKLKKRRANLPKDSVR